MPGTIPSPLIRTMSPLALSDRLPSLSQVIFGAAMLGGCYQEVSDETAQQTLKAAARHGITYFDTDPHYGAGLSEKRVGNFLASNRNSPPKEPDLHKRIRLSTKCGRYILPASDPDVEALRDAGRLENQSVFFTDNAKGHEASDKVCWDYTYGGMLRSAEQSLDRLQTQSFEVLRLHDAEDAERFAEAHGAEDIGKLLPAKGAGAASSSSFLGDLTAAEAAAAAAASSDAASSEGFGKSPESKTAEKAEKHNAIAAFLDLKKVGVCKEISLGCNSPEYLEKWIKTYPPGTFDSIMGAGVWNLLDQSGYRLLQECQARGIAVDNVGIFVAGALWGMKKYRYNDISPEVAAKVARWTELAEENNVSLPAVALRFAFLPDVVAKVAIGMQAPEQVEKNAALFSELAAVEGKVHWAALWKKTQAEGLIAPEVDLSGMK